MHSSLMNNLICTYTYSVYLCSYLICTKVVFKEFNLEAKGQSQMHKIDSTLQKIN